jgi:DNA topoisomerase-1
LSKLPNLNKGDALSIANFTARESFSRAKPRYTEASLVKKIEEMGIGRPSTFATMVSTVQDRGYVSKETREGAERTSCRGFLLGKYQQHLRLFGGRACKSF